MTRKCCVPGCKSNYSKSGEPYVSTFSFPKDEAARKLWLSKIGREEMSVTQSVGVCSKHFLEEDILRETSAYDDLKNVILTCPLKTPRIREGAIPSIIPARDPNDAVKEERTPRKAKKKAVKRIRDDASSPVDDLIIETTDEKQEKDRLLGALNLDPTTPVKSEAKSLVDAAPGESNAGGEKAGETEVKKATYEQVRRLKVNERERKETKRLKKEDPIKVAPSIFRVRLDQSKIAAALNGGILPNGSVPVPIAPKPVLNPDDPDHCFFMSLCSDFKQIQNPKTKAFLKMEFQRMVFNAKYEKPGSK